jgi:hypothetical protein
VPWRIDYEGEVYREGDLTLDQIGKVERLTEKSWLHIQPIRFAGDAIATLAVMVNARKGEQVEDVLTKVGALKPGQYLDMIELEDDHDLPAEYRDGFPPVADESTST